MPIFIFIGLSYLEDLKIDDKFINKRVQLFIHQTMCLKRVENKKLRRNKDILKYVKWQQPEVFYKKAAAKNLAIFTGKHLCWSLLQCSILANGCF